LLIYRSENPGVLKNVANTLLLGGPIVRSGLRGRSSMIGFLNISRQKLKTYYAEGNLDFKILLILDNASVEVLDLRVYLRT
jgi:hypothetical protein